jgi:protein arginine N-methyltransferase 1
MGSGLGLYSIFASKAGAKHVYSIENSKIHKLTRKIVAENLLEQKITVLNCEDLESLTLPVENIDIIICDWMGVFLFKDSLIKDLIYARDKWLANDGLIFPNKVNLNIAGIRSDKIYNELKFWDNVYDLDMTIIKQQIYVSGMQEYTERNFIISTVCEVFKIDLYVITLDELLFSTKYELTFNKNERIVGLASWFDVFFDLPFKVHFTTGPYNRRTSCKNVMFYLDTPEIILKNEKLTGSIAIRVGDISTDVKLSFHFNGKLSNKIIVRQYKL